MHTNAKSNSNWRLDIWENKRKGKEKAKQNHKNSWRRRGIDTLGSKILSDSDDIPAYIVRGCRSLDVSKTLTLIDVYWEQMRDNKLITVPKAEL